MGIIAWRQHYLTEVGREYASLPASEFLSPMEIESLKVEFEKSVNSKLTLGEAWHLIARLGGFLDRESDREPGPTTFWRGLQQIIYAAKVLERIQQSIRNLDNTDQAA